MGIASSVAPIGGIFDPADQDAVATQGAAITSELQPGSAYYQSGNMGAAGQQIVSRGTYLQNRNVGEDYSQMQNDQAQLTALGQHFANLYQTGGPEAVAAAAAAQANTANSGGGLGGLKTMAAQSAKNTAAVGQAAQTERDAYGSQATASNAASAASKLQQTLIQSAINHANRSKNISATAIKAQEAIDQQSINNSLQDGANSAMHDVRSKGIENSASQAALGISAASAALTAGASGTALALKIANSGTPTDDTAMTGSADSLNDSGTSVTDAAGNEADAANIPTDSLADYAVMTPYGASVATPEDAWYNYLTTAPQSANNAAYTAYQGASTG